MKKTTEKTALIPKLLYPKKISFHSGYFLIFTLFFLLVHCTADKAKANEKKSEECRRLVFLQILEKQNQNQNDLPIEESRLLSNTNIKLAYSCSAESGDSPSCREFYSTNSDQVFLEELCPTRYRKFKASCSRQNFIGECRLLNPENNRYEKRIYAKPNDEINEAKNNCLIAGGRFIDRAGEDLTIPLLVACELSSQ